MKRSRTIVSRTTKWNQERDTLECCRPCWRQHFGTQQASAKEAQRRKEREEEEERGQRWRFVTCQARLIDGVWEATVQRKLLLTCASLPNIRKALSVFRIGIKRTVIKLTLIYFLLFSQHGFHFFFTAVQRLQSPIKKGRKRYTSYVTLDRMQVNKKERVIMREKTDQSSHFLLPSPLSIGCCFWHCATSAPERITSSRL